MSKRKLLLADDSITIQKVVNLTFADEGIEVISVGDGDSAMRKFDEFMPDLVMADVNMPGLSGYEVCRIIKRTEETQNIPVILLVGSFEPFDEAEAKDAGADDFLTKPFQSIRQLVNKVTDLLNQREQSATDAAYMENPPPSVVDTFAETLELEKQPEAPTAPSESHEFSSEFGDAGMDDEMIETSPANGYVSASETEPDYQTDAEAVDYGKTQPLSADELKGFDIVPGSGREASATYENLEPVTETTEETPLRAEAASFDEEARKLGYMPSYQHREPEEREEVISETEPEIDYYLPEGDEKEEFEEQVTDAETLEPEVEYAPQEPREADFSQASEEDSGEKSVEETAETEAPVEESGATESAPYAFNENEYSGYTRTEETDEPVNETTGDAEESSSAPTAETSFDAPAQESARYDEAPQTEPDYEETAQTRAVEDYETAETPEAESDLSEEDETNGATQEVETVTETPVSARESVPAFANFDDGDLLELPPLVEETGIRPQPKAQPVAAEPEPSAEVSAEPETETPPAEAAETEDNSAQSQVAASFPPELIEAIAQKVAEQISAKTMRDVLPQITELVMKKMAEEKSDEKK